MRVPASLVAAVATFAFVAVAFAAPAFADAGWQSPDTLTGLVGSYTRPPFGGGPIAYVSLRGSDGYRAQGPYTRFVDGAAGLVMQTGTYSAIANNPAVGAFILFLDDKGEAREAYFILGIKRDPLGGKITALELGDPNTGRPFSLVRVGL